MYEENMRYRIDLVELGDIHSEIKSLKKIVSKTFKSKSHGINSIKKIVFQRKKFSY
jgi:hypothetical protein